MGDGAWIVSAFKQESKAYGSKEAAERAAAKIGGVAWWCEGIEPPAKVPQPCVLVPRTGERMVERVLGHLGMRTATTGEIA